jgi:hypothetical protein
MIVDNRGVESFSQLGGASYEHSLDEITQSLTIKIESMLIKTDHSRGAFL